MPREIENEISWRVMVAANEVWRTQHLKALMGDCLYSALIGVRGPNILRLRGWFELKSRICLGLSSIVVPARTVSQPRSRGNRTENNLRVVDHHKEDRGYAWLVSINFESKHVESAEHDYGSHDGWFLLSFCEFRAPLAQMRAAWQVSFVQHVMNGGEHTGT